MEFKLDDWQKEILETEGNIALRSGRQVGKSTIIAIKAAEFAIKHPKKTILIISAVERQAQLLFEKTLGYIIDKYKSCIKKGKFRPTKHIIYLVNGSKIYSLPTGMDGHGIRGYTVDLLIIDECGFVPEDVFQAVTPMLATTRGNIVALSTPFGKGGWFYERFSDPSFKTFHISSEDCPRINKEYLVREKKRMTALQYAQEYLGEFVDELRQFFPTDLIKKCMTLQREDIPVPASLIVGDKFIGVDIAQMGEDESVLLSLTRVDRGRLSQIDMDITVRTRLPETIRRIKYADLKYNFKKIYIDDGGIGAGVFDSLLEDDQTKRKVIAINNASRPLDRDKTQRKRILKEDLYTNLLKLMEDRKIEIFNEPEILLSLKSVQYEYKEGGRIRIFGNYTHIAEALVRAAWCIKDKSLNIWIRY